jgi:carbon storage regulator
MLVLTRHEGESIQIGTDVTVMITRIGAGRVELGITAPPAVAVVRTELDTRHEKGVSGR